MESAGLRNRQRATSLEDHHLYPSPPSLTLPRFTVNLSIPPEQRYTHIAPAFREQVHTLPGLYDEILETFVPPRYHAWLHYLSRIFLRRVYNEEETRELHGISAASQIPMYLLVAFNVLLDLFMGCTSGGVRVQRCNPPSAKSRMLSFRALDWGMEPLRQIVMEVDFVRSEGGPVVATSVTYFGYIGVLTGVRKSLSLCLNFRPRHDGTSYKKQCSYGWHLLMVLFGFRSSISSVLRRLLLQPEAGNRTLDEIVKELKGQKSTAAYLILSDGEKTVNLEKDHCCAQVQSSNNFIVALNHDIDDEINPQNLQQRANTEPKLMAATGMSDIVLFSLERKACIQALYKHTLRNKNVRKQPLGPIYEDEVIDWMEGPDIVNDETHYAVVMDAVAGKILWSQRWLSAIDVEEE